MKKTVPTYLALLGLGLCWTPSASADILLSSDLQSLTTSGSETFAGVGYRLARHKDIIAAGHRISKNKVSIFEKVNGAWIETVISKPSFTSSEWFGASVAVSNGVVAIGTRENAGATGAGSVYIYEKSGSTWTETSVLNGTTPASGDQFGTSVALRAETNTSILVIGAPGEDTGGSNSGAAYVYRRGNGQTSWTFVKKLTPDTPGEGFGRQVSLTGRNFVVSAPFYDSPSFQNEGRIYIYDSQKSDIPRKATLTSDHATAGSYLGFFGAAIHGATVAVSGYNNAETSNRCILTFRETAPNSWEQILLAPPNPHTSFGYGLALKDRALAVGEPYLFENNTYGKISLYERWGSSWADSTVVENFAPGTGQSDNFGLGLSLADGELTASAPYYIGNGHNNGLIYTLPYELREAKCFTPADEPLLSADTPTANRKLGTNVVRSKNLIVSSGKTSSPGGLVSIFEKVGSDWEETVVGAEHLTSGSRFGSALASDGSMVAIGTASSSSSSGAARVHLYEKGAGGWAETHTFEAPGGNTSARFGSSVTVREYSDVQLVIVGAPRDTEAGSYAGAVYVYSRLTSEGTWALEQKIVPPADYGRFGSQVVIGSTQGTGERIAISAPFDRTAGSNRGKVYVYRREFSAQGAYAWTEEATLLSDYYENRSSYLGMRLAFQGRHIAASTVSGGTSNNNAIIAFTEDENGNWDQSRLVTDPETKGGGYGTFDLDGDQLVFANYYSDLGMVQVHHRVGTEWELSQTLHSPGDESGFSSVSLFDGHLVVGSPNTDTGATKSGGLYLFETKDPKGPFVSEATHRRDLTFSYTDHSNYVSSGIYGHLSTQVGPTHTFDWLYQPISPLSVVISDTEIRNTYQAAGDLLSGLTLPDINSQTPSYPHRFGTLTKAEFDITHFNKTDETKFHLDSNDTELQARIECPRQEALKVTGLFVPSRFVRLRDAAFVDPTLTREELFGIIQEELVEDDFASLQLTIPAGETSSETLLLAPRHLDYVSGYKAKLQHEIVVPRAGQLSPLLKDLHGNDIADSEWYEGLPNTTSTAPDPVEGDLVAYRELSLNVHPILEGKILEWEILPYRTEKGLPIEGSLSGSSHPMFLETSTVFNTQNFLNVGGTMARTTIDEDGKSSIRVNLPNIRFNKAEIRVKVIGTNHDIEVFNIEVPSL